MIHKKTGAFYKLFKYNNNGLTDITNVVIKIQIKDMDNKLLSNVFIQKIDLLQGFYTGLVSDCTKWPSGQVRFDILYTINSVLQPTETEKITVVDGVTE